MSKHLKDFHGNAAKQETPHPGVKADTRQDVVDKLNEMVGKINKPNSIAPKKKGFLPKKHPPGQPFLVHQAKGVL